MQVEIKSGRFNSAFIVISADAILESSPFVDVTPPMVTSQNRLVMS